MNPLVPKLHDVLSQQQKGRKLIPCNSPTTKTGNLHPMVSILDPINPPASSLALWQIIHYSLHFLSDPSLEDHTDRSSTAILTTPSFFSANNTSWNFLGTPPRPPLTGEVGKQFSGLHSPFSSKSNPLL